MKVIYEIIILLILLGLSAFFSGSETALFSLSEIKIRRLVKEKRRGAKTLQKLKSNPGMLLSTILIGNNIVNIAASALATVVSIHIFGDIGTGIAVGVLTVLILIFGEIFPKSVAYNNAENISLLVARPLRVIMIIFWPVARLFSILNEKLTKANKQGVTEEDVKIALTMGEESGSIEKDEKLMIHNIFEFSDTHVSQIMTPRDDIIDIRKDSTIEDAINIMIDRGVSRLPVYKDGKDDIVGLVSLKDMLKHMKDGSMKKKITDDIQPVLFVPEIQRLDTLLDELRKKQFNMAIVVDENGNVSGLVTIEDLVEEIVGEIYDETDKEAIGIKKVDKKTVIVEGKTKLIDLRKYAGIKLTDKDINTVAGFITETLERLPRQGEIIETDNASLTILKSTDKEILKVKIKKK
ncbi:MAG: HlyC/CorC family transporter [Candidatus Micrarchaeota archaeon]|nr:HlyC/CorC family transporter [Candidatus Micrarchaeota archaeon]